MGVCVFVAITRTRGEATSAKAAAHANTVTVVSTGKPLAVAPTPAPPPKAPMASPGTTGAALSGDHDGSVSVEGPKGTKVFDGDKLMGTIGGASVRFVAKPGTHVVRVEHPVSKDGRVITILVEHSEAVSIVAGDLDTKPRGGVAARSTLRNGKPLRNGSGFRASYCPICG